MVPLGGRGHLRVEGFQLFPQDTGKIPEGVVDVDDNLFHSGTTILPGKGNSGIALRLGSLKFDVKRPAASQPLCHPEEEGVMILRIPV